MACVWTTDGTDDRVRRHVGRPSVLLHEPNPIGLWSRWDRAFSGALWRVEALRTIDRLRLTHEIEDSQLADLVEDVQLTHETFNIHPVNAQILLRASETFPTVVETLDAIHLATALFVRESVPIDYILTHDSQLGTAARSLGFNVMGMS